MRLKALVIIGISYYTFAFSYQPKQENTPPKIEINLLTDGNTFQWNTVVPYTIDVSDIEDGNSAYDEIPANEIILLVQFLEDSLYVSKHLLGVSKMNLKPLQLMGTSTCFNCHLANNSFVGPSFKSIVQRYENSNVAKDSLAKRIVVGTAGRWGDSKMPPHPDLEIEEAREIVNWIFNITQREDFDYLVGTRGSFRIQEKPYERPWEGVYALTALYLDHGIKNLPKSRKLGSHTVILRNQ